jgi:hypothetical protein
LIAGATALVSSFGVIAAGVCAFLFCISGGIWLMNHFEIKEARDNHNGVGILEISDKVFSQEQQIAIREALIASNLGGGMDSYPGDTNRVLRDADIKNILAPFIASKDGILYYDLGCFAVTHGSPQTIKYFLSIKYFLCPINETPKYGNGTLLITLKEKK